MWINDVEVTPDNAGDLSVIDGVSGQLSFDYKTNTLKMKNALYLMFTMRLLMKTIML